MKLPPVATGPTSAGTPPQWVWCAQWVGVGLVSPWVGTPTCSLVPLMVCGTSACAKARGSGGVGGGCLGPLALSRLVLLVGFAWRFLVVPLRLLDLALVCSVLHGGEEMIVFGCIECG